MALAIAPSAGGLPPAEQAPSPQSGCGDSWSAAWLDALAGGDGDAIDTEAAVSSSEACALPHARSGRRHIGPPDADAPERSGPAGERRDDPDIQADASVDRWQWMLVASALPSAVPDAPPPSGDAAEVECERPRDGVHGGAAEQRPTAARSVVPAALVAVDSEDDLPVSSEPPADASGVADQAGPPSLAASSSLRAATSFDLPAQALDEVLGKPAAPIRAAVIEAAMKDATAGESAGPAPLPADFNRAAPARPVAAEHGAIIATPVPGAEPRAADAVPAESIAAPPAAPEPRLADQIVQAMRLQWHAGEGTAHVTLEPDYLGAVTIALRVRDGRVVAALHADNAQVRAWLEANEPALRDGLQAHGLALDRLTVADRPESFQRAGEDDGQRGRQDEPRRRQSRRARAGTFEIVV